MRGKRTDQVYPKIARYIATKRGNNEETKQIFY